MILYTVRRNFPQPYRGKAYKAGDAITSEEIGNWRRERQFVDLQWIVPVSKMDDPGEPPELQPVSVADAQPAASKRRGRWGQAG